MHSNENENNTLAGVYYSYSLNFASVQQFACILRGICTPVTDNNGITNAVSGGIAGNLTELKNINFQGQNVRESLMRKQIGISYFPAGYEFPIQIYHFTRVFFDGESFLAFYISAPAERIDDLLIYKNLFFQNTDILY